MNAPQLGMHCYEALYFIAACLLYYIGYTAGRRMGHTEMMPPKAPIWHLVALGLHAIIAIVIIAGAAQYFVLITRDISLLLLSPK
jgi:hypothetical protein